MPASKLHSSQKSGKGTRPLPFVSGKGIGPSPENKEFSLEMECFVNSEQYAFCPSPRQKCWILKHGKIWGETMFISVPHSKFWRESSPSLSPKIYALAAISASVPHKHISMCCNAIIDSRPSDHYFRSVSLSVCLSVCLCRVFLSRLRSDFDQTWTYVICLGL